MKQQQEKPLDKIFFILIKETPTNQTFQGKPLTLNKIKRQILLENMHFFLQQKKEINKNHLPHKRHFLVLLFLLSTHTYLYLFLFRRFYIKFLYKKIYGSQHKKRHHNKMKFTDFSSSNTSSA